MLKVMYSDFLFQNCPSCAKSTVRFHRLSGITIRFPCITSCPMTQSSSFTILYVVPCNLLQSPEITAWHTSSKVGSLAERAPTSEGTKATGIAWLATLYANSSVSLQSPSAETTGKRLRTSATLSVPRI